MPPSPPSTTAFIARPTPLPVATTPPIRSPAERGEDTAGRQAVGVQHLVMAAVAMDEFILEGEGVDAAARLLVPGKLLHPRREARAGQRLLDHDDAPMGGQRLGKPRAVEGLQRVDGSDRH